MKYFSSKWLQACVLIVAVVALVIVGCGGGGGGGSSSAPIKTRTLTGIVMAPVAQNVSLLSSSGNSPVANAKVWLEGFSNIQPQYTDASGTYTFIGVPAAEHFVIASFEYSGKTYKQRIRVLIQSADVDIKAPNLDLEEATLTLTGVLKDSAGNVLPAGSEMKLWGETFTIGSNGSFTTPPLPISISQAEIFVKLPGASTFTSFYGPFIGGSTPAFIEQTVLLPDSGNIAPSGVLLAKNTAGIKTVNCVTNEQLNFSLSAHDPDTGHLSNLKYQWAASRGTLQVTGNQTTATWVAMDSYGVATVSVVITDPKGASGKVSLRVLVNIQSMDDTDTTSPTIVSRVPAANSIGVTPGSTVSVGFSEDLLASSVTSGAIAVTSQGASVPGASVLQADKKTIVWTPTTALPGNQTITIALSSTISDLYGNQIGSQNSWTFTTALIPGVTVNFLYTNDTTPEITGTVDDPDTTVQVTVNSRTYSATLDGTFWKAQVTDVLADGVYNVGVSATNKSGITGSDSSSNELTVDTGPKTAVLSNLPPAVTSSTQTAITVGGTGVVKYLFRYRMLGDTWGSWSAEKAVSEKIALSGLVDGIYNLQVRAIDVAGNVQLEEEATAHDWTIDTTTKTAAFNLSTLPLDPTNQTTANITVEGAGVEFYRFRLNAGSWSVTYPVATTISLVGLKSGTNTISLIGGDSYGNWQSINAPTTFTWVIDANVKIAVLSNKPVNPTNNNNVDITVGGAGVTKYMYSVDGGTVWSDPASVSENITMINLADGSYSVRVVGGDDLENWQQKANATIWEWTVDTVVPTVALTTTVADPTNVNPIPVTIEFSEAVAGFELGDITVANGVAANLQAVTAGKVWTVAISPAGNGVVSVDLAAGVAADAAGNSSVAAGQLSVTYDSDRPAAILATTEPDPTKNSPITVTVSFTPPVSGFDLTDLTIGNATVSNLQVVTADQEWTFDVTPVNQGEVTVDLAADKVTDSAGNGNTAANHLSFVYDSVIPSVVLSTTAASPTNTSPIPVVITFSEAVSGFVIGDITVGNGTAGNMQVVTADKAWSVEVTPNAEGVVTVAIAENLALDGAGNGNSASAQLSVSYDSVKPTVVLATTAGATTNTSPIPVSIDFSEVVAGFQLSQLTITNGTAGNLQVVTTDKSWTFDVTPSGNGEVTINLLADKVADPAGNGNVAAPAQISVIYDSERPAATLTTTSSDPSNASPIPVTVVFSKDITGFELADLTIGNGTAGNLQIVTANRSWSFDVTPTLQGAVTVNLGSDKVFDSAGNGNTAAAQVRVVYDSVGASVTLASTAPANTNLSSIPITVTFSEPVTGFNLSGLTVTNGSAGSLQVVTANRVWSAVITPAAQGVVTVDLGAGVAADNAGNANSAAAQLSRVYDITQPAVELTTAAADPTNSTTIPVTITFNEDITGFAIGQLVVGNGIAGNLQVAVANRAWTVDVTPSADGAVTVNMAAGQVVDAAGNSNTAAVQLSRTYDSVKPAAVITSALTGPTNGNPFLVTVTFNEDVSGFVAGDLTVGNGTPANEVNTIANRVWTVEIFPTADGAVDIDLSADKAFDSAGNGNTAATRLTIQSDRANPTVVLSTTVVSPTNTNPIPVTITFSETVTGFEISDLTVVNGVAGNLQVVTAGEVWTVDVIPSVNGALTVNLAADKAIDVAGNGNTAAGELSVTYSSDRPMAVFSSPATDPTNNNPIAVTITFSEVVTGFEQSDLVVTNATIGNLTNPTPGVVWNFDVTPTSNGLVTVNLPADRVINAATNGNTAAAQFSRTYDSVRPAATLTTTSPAIINSGTIPVTVTFSKDITGFDLSYLTLVNGNAGNLQTVTANRVWSFDITPIAGGVVTVSMAENEAFDSAGNGNTAASAINVTYDSTQPSATLSSVANGTTTNIKTRPVTVTFGETVTGFTLADITVTNGSTSNLQVVTAGTVWSFDVTAVNNGLVKVDLPADKVVDGAGNGNTAAAQISWTYDAGKPSVILEATGSNPTNTSPIPVRITFSEDVTGFELADLTVGNGVAGDFTATTPGRVWTVNVTPSGSGAVTVSLSADKALDLAGNGNTAATQISVLYDNAGPEVALSTTTTSPTNTGPILVTITFNEVVTGFDIGDVTVVNGTKGSLQVVTANRVWRVYVSPVAHGNVTVDVNAGVAADLAGNVNTAATQLVVNYDIDKPGAVFTSTAISPTGISPIPVTITFDEAVTGFFASDLVVGNGVATGLTVEEAGIKWSFNVVPTTSGVVTVDLPANRANDTAGNGNDAALQFSIDYDNVKPTAVLSTTATDPTNTSPFVVTVTFSEDVSGFDATDLTIANGSAGNLQVITASRVWTVDVTPAADGLVTVNLPAGMATDSSGNGNSAAAQISRTFDSMSPTVILSTTAPVPPASTNTNPIPVTITFNENVAGFDLGYLAVGNGVAGDLAVVTPNRVWRVNVVPAGNGAVTVDMAAGETTDAAGNGNSVATQLVVNYDSIQPSVTFSSAAPARTNASTIPFTVTFSKEVTGFELADLTIGNGTAGSLVTVIAGLEYTFAVTPSYDGTVTVDMAAGKVKDLSNNDNTAAAQISRIYDTTGPSPVVSTLANLTNGTPFDVTVTFDEDVIGLDSLDFSVSSGTAGVVTEVTPGRVWTVSITPTADPVTISLPADVVTDVAGNNNFASNQIVVTFDGVQPSVTLSTAVTSPTNASIIPVTIEFSEEVTGFEVGDLTIGNASIGDFAETGYRRTWSVNLVPEGSPVTLALGANVAQDLAGNFNTAAAPSISIDYDGTAPTVTLVTSSTPDGSYTTTNVIEILVGFSENVLVTGSPTLTLETGAVDRTIIYTGSDVPNVLKFSYTVQTGDASADLDYTSTTALALNGGTIKDAVGNDAILTLPMPAAAESLGGTTNIVIDTRGPLVINVTSAANGTHTTGSIIEVVVQFDRVVSVTGTPRLVLETGAADRAINYSAGDGTDAMTFNYTVQAGDNSPDLDYTSATALTLNGGTITDAVGNNAVLTLPVPGTAGSLAANAAIVIDTLGPRVSFVTSSTADSLPGQQYGLGTNINVQVVFDENVYLTGTRLPLISLNLGTARIATYTFGADTNTLNFNYIVLPGDVSNDLEYSSTAALTLNGSFINDAIGNPAIRTLPAPGAANSLSANKTIRVYAAP